MTSAMADELKSCCHLRGLKERGNIYTERDRCSDKRYNYSVLCCLMISCQHNGEEKKHKRAKVKDGGMV